MHIPLFQKLLWGATFIGEVALLGVLFRRSLWRTYLAFTALIAYHVAAEPAIFLAYRYGSRPLTNFIYWIYVVLDFALQFAVVWQLARIVLRPTGTWVQDARRQFIMWAGAGVLVSIFCALSVNPPTLDLLGSLELKGNLFTSLLVLQLAIAMSFAANALGIGWKNHVMAVTTGVTFWLVISSVVDALHSYLGDTRLYYRLDEVRGAASLATLVYWIVQLSRPEPEPQPISPALRRYIADLHDRVALDLNRIS